MIIYTCQKSKRKPQNTAKKQGQRAEWNALLKKYGITETKKSAVPQLLSVKTNTLFDDRSTKHIPSVHTSNCDTFRKQSPQYTGDAVVGISTLHKSNAIPVFSKQQAQETAQMRRG